MSLCYQARFVSETLGRERSPPRKNEPPLSSETCVLDLGRERSLPRKNEPLLSSEICVRDSGRERSLPRKNELSVIKRDLCPRLWKREKPA